MNKPVIPRSATLTACTAVLGTSIALSGGAFAMQPLAQGYMLAAQEAAQAGTPEKKPEAKTAEEGKCGEGKCGAGMQSETTKDKAATDKAKADEAKKKAGKKAGMEGKCGEGKCGGQP